ncbi:MAG: carboxypeptidase-like regulatory domain-containing protein [Bacteroidia bacterium]|nr:carboxypeptidase-like regulatory domain-containing protein [Bacteroidia bacterium]
MKIFLSIILFTSSLIASSQEIKRVIVDSKTKEPIPYATIKILHTNKGKIANSNGEFKLDFQLNDSIFISSVGYLDTILIGKNIDKLIFLISKPSVLDNIVVSNPKIINRFIIGNGAEFINKKTICNFKESANIKLTKCLPWTGGGGAEFAEPMMLPDTNKIYRLSKAYIPVKYTSSCWQPIFIQVYEADSINGMPGSLIFRKHLSLKPENYKKGKIILDLHNENIFFIKQKKFFISISWDTENSNKNCLTGILLFRDSEGICYSRSIVFNDYHWIVFDWTPQKENSFERLRTIFAAEIEEME